MIDAFTEVESVLAAELAQIDWAAMWQKITDLKCKVRALYSLEACRDERILAEVNEYADALIYEFIEVYRARMDELDKGLWRDLFGVFAIREFAYRDVVRRLTREQWAAAWEALPPDIADRRVSTVRTLVRTAAEICRQEFARLSEEGQKPRAIVMQELAATMHDLKGLAPLLQEAQAMHEDWLDLKIRSDYLNDKATHA